MPDRGPYSRGFWNTQNQLFITYSNQRFQQRPPTEKSLKLASCQARPVASLVLATFLQSAKMHFLGGGEGAIGRGGGVNVWSKGGGAERTKFLVSGNQKAVPSRTQNNLQPLLAQNSVLPLGGCGDELTLRLRLAFGTGLLSDSNVRRIGHEGFSDWCCTAHETWKAPPSQNI